MVWVLLGWALEGRVDVEGWERAGRWVRVRGDDIFGILRLIVSEWSKDEDAVANVPLVSINSVITERFEIDE